MPYYIYPIEDEQCVYVTCESELAEALTRSAGMRVNTLLTTKAWNRLVVDGTQLQSAPDAVELLEFSEGFFSNLPRGVSIAFVVRQDQLKRARFVEKIACNRGVQVACFTDVEDATIWVNLVEAVSDGP